MREPDLIVATLQDDVVLHDVELPTDLLGHWQGPRHGLAGAGRYAR